MDTSFEVVGRRSNSLPSSKFVCDQENRQLACLSAKGFVESESFVQEKNKKKKKKHKGGLQSPKQILAFNTSKLLKLDEQKAEMRRCCTGDSSRILSKYRSFPSNSTLKAVTEGSGNLQDSKEHTTSSFPDKKLSVLSRFDSLPLISAVRGSFEELGNGPRPKLHVQWDPSVWEPPCSTISHTVTMNHLNKKSSKHGRRGKFSSADPCLEQNGREAQSGQLESDPSKSTNALGFRHEQSSQDGQKNVGISKQNGGLIKSSFMVVTIPVSVLSVDNHVSKEFTKHGTGQEAETEPVAKSVQYAADSTCGGSFLAGATVPRSTFYGEVL